MAITISVFIFRIGISPLFFGNDWFALKAEASARFFGTPFFLVTQTLGVAVWIIVNAVGITTSISPHSSS